MEDKVAMVTGGAQGIGKAYTQELLRNGAKVLICDIDDKCGLETTEELQNEFGKDRVAFYVCDVTNWEMFEGCFKEAVETFGGLDIIVNNAGICDETQDGWKSSIEVNFVGVVNGTKLGFKYMSQSNGGSGGIIVNIASITSLEPWECNPVYSATKAAVNQLSRSYGTALHFKDTAVKVVSINPGLTITKILNEAKEKCISQEAQEMIPKILEVYPLQKVENMGRGLIHIINTASNGSIWTIEDNKPPQPTILK